MKKFYEIKRAIIGAFHHIWDEHMNRYLHEFDFRWNNRDLSDLERTVGLLKMVDGKRLTYREPTSAYK